MLYTKQPFLVTRTSINEVIRVHLKPNLFSPKYSVEKGKNPCRAFLVAYIGKIILSICSANHCQWDCKAPFIPWRSHSRKTERHGVNRDKMREIPIVKVVTGTGIERKYSNNSICSAVQNGFKGILLTLERFLLTFFCVYSLGSGGNLLNETRMAKKRMGFKHYLRNTK